VSRNARIVIVVLIIVLVLMALGVINLRADVNTQGAPATAPPAPTSTAFVVANMPTALSASTTVTTPAVRAAVQIAVSEPPVFDHVGHVNGLDYRGHHMGPAMEAYRIAAAWFGWDDDTIEARATFVFRVMATESAGCWNARRWTYFEADKPCTEHRTGVHDDVGFGQLTNSVRSSRDALCGVWGICTWQ